MIADPKCDELVKKLDYPPPNNLIAKNRDILPKNEKYSTTPVLLKSWPGETDLWYKKDDKFGRPKAVISFRFYTNDVKQIEDINARVFSLVWSDIVDEYLREFNYMAEMAMLKFHQVVDIDCIYFKWSGYNDSMPNYVIETIERLVSMKTADVEKIFNQVKEKLLLQYENFYLQ